MKDWLSFFLENKCSVIPLKKKEKKPAIKWKKYTKQKLTKEEIEKTLQKVDSKNVGVICGSISANLLVLDIDKAELFEKLNLGEIAAKTLAVRTAHGYHIYLRIDDPKLDEWIGKKGVKTLYYPPKEKGQEEESHEEIRFQWSNHYVVCPGSIHPSGTIYEHLATSPKEIKKAKGVGLLEEIEQRWISYHKLEKKGVGALKEPLLDFIKRYTTVKEVVDQDDYIQMWSPFHKGTSPTAFTIYKSDNHWYDFSEEIGGQHIEFLMRFKGISKKEAYDELGVEIADRKGVSATVPLLHGDNDFGTLLIKRENNKKFIVSIESEESPLSERSVPADFYRSEWYQNVIFKHIKHELEDTDYEKFLQYVSNEIEDTIGEIPETESKDVEYLTKGFLGDDVYFEEILKDEIEQFIVYNTKTDEWRFEMEIKHNDTVIYPVPIPQTQRASMTLADGVEEYGSLRDLRKEMISFAFEEFDPVENRELFELVIHLELVSWIASERMKDLTEKFIPILSARGPSETGKKRFLTVARWLSYRSLYALKTTKVPTLFRAIAPWGGTLILDEADLTDSSESNEFVEFMNSRSDGVPIPRYNSGAQIVEFFHSFGLTVIAERSAASDDGYESRKIIFPSDATTQPEKYSLIPSNGWSAKGKQLQRKLLLFRLRHLKGEVPSNLIIEGIKGFRVRESLLLLQTLKDEDNEIVSNLEQLAKILQQRIIEERSGSMEGMIMNIVYNKILDDNARIEPFRGVPEIIMEYTKGEDSYSTPLTLKTISKALGEQLTPSDVARRWRGLGQGLRARGRVDGKLYAGIVQILHPKRFLREIEKYVTDVDYDELKSKLRVQEMLFGEDTGAEENVVEARENVKKESSEEEKNLVPKEIKKIILQVGKCTRCHKEEVDLIYTIHYSDDTFKYVCGKCGEQIMSDYHLKLISSEQ